MHCGSLKVAGLLRSQGMLQLLAPRQADLRDSFAVCSQLISAQALSKAARAAAMAKRFIGMAPEQVGFGECV